MPILKGSVTFARFTVEAHGGDHRDFAKDLPDALRGLAFEPLDVEGSMDDRSVGFVEVEDHDRAEFDADNGEHALFTWRCDEVKVHAAVLKKELERWAKAFEAEHSRPPGRREKQDAKAGIRRALRLRSPVVTTTTDVAWHLSTGEVQFWTASQRVVDEVQDALEQALKVRLVPVVPAVVADRMGLVEKALAPTPELLVRRSGAAPRDTDDDEAREVEQGAAREQLLRGKAYLGREFLTWLLWRSESGEPLFERDGAPVTVLFTGGVNLRGITGDVVEGAMRGATAPYSKLIRQALDRGLLVHAGRLAITHGERRYQVSLDAERFLFKGCKLPALMTEEADDRTQERMFLVGELAAMVDALLTKFLRRRASSRWAETVGDMLAWMGEDAREAA